ncbi:MAG: hypothetical protein M3Y89_18595 [Actinomycetota bacterium]|nr:hypothetical protein [Actinomycetota bacterium]
MGEMASEADGVVVTYGASRWELGPAEVLTFGRASSCTVCLDADDLGISRLAGSVEHEAGTWWLLNRSTVRPLTAADELGIRSVLAPGRRLAVAGSLTVMVEGSARRHAIDVMAERFPVAGATPEQASDALPTARFDAGTVNDLDRLALVALFAGYLEAFPRYDPHPRSYADASAELGWSRTTLVKRVEHLRTRLTGAGVPNLVGETALQQLAEWALTTGVVGRNDLALLRPPR